MITPPCDSPGCKQPSVHDMGDWRKLDSLTAWWGRHLCVSCYERKVWGKA